MYEKLKSLLDSDTLFLCGLIILVAIASFLLGRYTTVVVTPPDTVPGSGIRLIASSSPLTGATSSAYLQTAAVGGQNDPRGEYVASKSGAKYHHVTCSGAGQIKDENKIYFATAIAAEAAGYTRAQNCDR